MSKDGILSLLVLVGLIFGIIVGSLLFDPSWATQMEPSQHRHSSFLLAFEFIGFDIFMGLLKMTIMPLIIASVISAVVSVGDFRQLGILGACTLIYYFSTMLIAVFVGLFFVEMISPGNAMQGASVAIDNNLVSEVSENSQGGLLGVFTNLVRLIIPQNIFKAIVEGHTLSVIFFSIFFASLVTLIGDAGQSIKVLVDAITQVMMRMIALVLWISPLGVFCLLAWTCARIGLGVFAESIGSYMLTVILGLLFHACLVLPALLYFIARVNPFSFFISMKTALLMAFGTSSSVATLPVSIDCATKGGGVSNRVAGLVLPLGATINMDGTALYEAVAVVFLAQASGIDLNGVQLLIIALTATLAAIGAAGIPSAGLVTMFIVVDAVNHSLASAGPEAQLIPVTAIGLIIGVDRILDMFRTSVNVWGDAVGSRMVTAFDARFSSSIRREVYFSHGH